MARSNTLTQSISKIDKVKASATKRNELANYLNKILTQS